MDGCLHDTLTLWLSHYGSIILFSFLLLGIVCFPIPDETLLIIAGIALKNGQLTLLSTLFAAYLGSILGISTSYFLGLFLGRYVVKKYGAFIGLKESHLDDVKLSYKKYGNSLLLFGYFIPGVRHITGFVFGLFQFEFKKFALFGFLGAVLWSTTFLSIGYFCGNKAKLMFQHEHLTITDLFLTILFFSLLFLSIKKLFKK